MPVAHDWLQLPSSNCDLLAIGRVFPQALGKEEVCLPKVTFLAGNRGAILAWFQEVPDAIYAKLRCGFSAVKISIDAAPILHKIVLLEKKNLESDM